MTQRKNILSKCKKWLRLPFDKNTQDAVKQLIEKDAKTLEEAFFRDLEFGTGGIRGIMGVGTNRINIYTIGKSTQGICDYIKKTKDNAKVVIAYDCRNNSKKFAQVAADIFSANGIVVYLFSDLRPTPELSFAIRHLGCQAGVVITASHNPSRYNGYKVYWDDGGQIVPPQDEDIVDYIKNTAFEDINFERDESLIHLIDEEIDVAFVEYSVAQGSFKDIDSSKISVVFTPLHGTSITIMPRIFKRAGYEKFHIVEEQSTPDGDFPTVASPNPEEKASLDIAIKKADEINADIVIATDPDSDRFGIAVRDLDGKMVCLNGNQTMIVLSDFLLKKRREKNSKKRGFIASTVVSTPVMQKIAAANNVDCKLTLTGFKWIGKAIRDFPELEFVGGGEESYGYLIGDFIRDKDAFTSALLTAEITAKAKSEGSSFFRELLRCYVEYGFYKEHLITLTKEGVDGVAHIAQMMENLRREIPEYIDDSKSVCVEDYLVGTSKDVIFGTVENLRLPKTDLLILKSKDGSQVAVRPSGTEPKIKFYIGVNTVLESVDKYKSADKFLNAKIQRIIQQLNL